MLEGNLAAVQGIMLCRPEVIAAYPITPQNAVTEALAELVASAQLNAKYVTVESEHSALSVCAGASAAGARTFTASSSQGILYMEEPIWMVPGLRLPVVMALVNRSLAFPGALLSDQNDSMLQRDTGWIQLYCENGQEILDNAIQAYRIAEDERVYLPVMFIYDGYTLSHTTTPVQIPDQTAVDAFLPPYEHKWEYLDPDRPLWAGIAPDFERSMEVRYQMEMAMYSARQVISEVDEEFGKTFGRRYGGLVEEYRCQNVEAVIITLGGTVGTAKDAVDELQAEGKPVGLVKIRAFRPFPTEELRAIARRVKAVGVIDRNLSHGSSGGGITALEVGHAIYTVENRPRLLSFVAGLAGRDITYAHVRRMAEKTLHAAETGIVENEVEWIGLRRKGA